MKCATRNSTDCSTDHLASLFSLLTYSPQFSSLLRKNQTFPVSLYMLDKWLFYCYHYFLRAVYCYWEEYTFVIWKYGWESIFIKASLIYYEHENVYISVSRIRIFQSHCYSFCCCWMIVTFSLMFLFHPQQHTIHWICRCLRIISWMLYIMI